MRFAQFPAFDVSLLLPGSSCATGSPSVLAGITDPTHVKRGICAAGHKAYYAAAWSGLPDKKFLTLLDPKLAALRTGSTRKLTTPPNPPARSSRAAALLPAIAA